jgi:hypothetical protein
MRDFLCLRIPTDALRVAQPAAHIGLIAYLVDTSLQDDIVRAAQRLLRLGRDILAASQ